MTNKVQSREGKMATKTQMRIMDSRTGIKYANVHVAVRHGARIGDLVPSPATKQVNHRIGRTQ
jgi:hypothetical protein